MVTPVEAQQVVEGVGPILQGNQAAARTRAVQDALRKALAQTIAEGSEPWALTGRPQTPETAWYGRTSQYIRSYRVLWEYPDLVQKVYRVGIEAEIAVEEAVQALKTPGAPASGSEKGLILVRIIENQPLRTGLGLFGRHEGVVAERIRAQLQAWGFRAVEPGAVAPWDGQERSALAVAKDIGAGVVMVGMAEAQQPRREGPDTALQVVQAIAQVRVLATQTGEQLALEWVQTSGVDTDAELGARQALEKAATALVTRLVPSLRTFQQQYQGMLSPSRDGR
jgi:hypothetical protein